SRRLVVRDDEPLPLHGVRQVVEAGPAHHPRVGVLPEQALFGFARLLGEDRAGHRVSFEGFGHAHQLLVLAALQRDRSAFARLSDRLLGGLGAPVRVVDRLQLGSDPQHDLVGGGAEFEGAAGLLGGGGVAGGAVEDAPRAGGGQAAAGHGVGVVLLLGQVVDTGTAHDDLPGGLLFGEGRGHDCSSRAHAAITCSGLASSRTAHRAVHTSPASSAYNLLAASMSVAAAAMRWPPSIWSSPVWSQRYRRTTVARSARRTSPAVSRQLIGTPPSWRGGRWAG